MSDDLVGRLVRAAKADMKRQLNGKPLPGGPGNVDDWSATGNSVELDEIVRACLAELSAAGYAVVPVEPTNGMEDAGINTFDEIVGQNNVKRKQLMQCWAAMIAAGRKEST